MLEDSSPIGQIGKKFKAKKTPNIFVHFCVYRYREKVQFSDCRDICYPCFVLGDFHEGGDNHTAQHGVTLVRAVQLNSTTPPTLVRYRGNSYFHAILFRMLCLSASISYGYSCARGIKPIPNENLVFEDFFTCK